MTTQGAFWTAVASREKAPSSRVRSVPLVSRRRAKRAHRAGTSVVATARHRSTTDTPAAPDARMKVEGKKKRPDREIATVTAEKITVRPARSRVRPVASSTTRRDSSSRPSGAPSSISEISSRKRETTSSP